MTNYAPITAHLGTQKAIAIDVSMSLEPYLLKQNTSQAAKHPRNQGGGQGHCLHRRDQPRVHGAVPAQQTEQVQVHDLRV